MRNLPETRGSLIVRLKQPGGHSDSAWGEFCGVYEAAVRGYARRRGLATSDAQDVCQEVLASVYQAIDRWQDDRKPASFRRWLSRVTHNAVVNAIKQRSRRVNATGDTPEWKQLESALADDPQSSQSAFDDEFRREVFRIAAKRVREQVNANTWAAFERTAVQQHNAEDVAAKLGMSVGSVYTARCRVLARLRQEVQNFLAEQQE